LLFFGSLGVVMAALLMWVGMLGWGVLLGCMAVAAVAAGAYPDIVMQRTFALLAYGIGALLVSYFVGLESAQGLLRKTDASQTITLATHELNGRIARSGERGLLFIDSASRQIRFLLWADVKELRSVVPKK
jgi:hypothetical protein